MASVAEAIGAAGSGDGWVRGDDLAAVSESRGASVGSEVSIRVASLSNGEGAAELQVTMTWLMLMDVQQEGSLRQVFRSQRNQTPSAVNGAKGQEFVFGESPRFNA